MGLKAKIAASKPSSLTLSRTNEKGVTTHASKPRHVRASHLAVMAPKLEVFQHVLPLLQKPGPAFGLNNKTGRRKYPRNGCGRKGQKPRVQGRWTQAGFIPAWAYSTALEMLGVNRSRFI